jgi:hypothetical protein
MSDWEATWNGGDLVDRCKRAQGRAVVAIGELVAQEAKRLAHVYTGTMRRSIHVAPAGYQGYLDEAVARNSELSGVTPEEVRDATVEVGSWVHYAEVEEVERGHEFVAPAVEAVRTQANEVIIRAAHEEGLS